MHAVTVKRLADRVRLVVGEAEGKVSVLHAEMAYVQLRQVPLGGKALLHIEPDQLHIVSNPYQAILYQHGLDIEVREGLKPRFQLFRHVLIINAQAVVVAAPDVAGLVFVFKEPGQRAFLLLLKCILTRIHIEGIARKRHGPHSARAVFLETGDVGNLAYRPYSFTGPEAAYALQFPYQIGAIVHGQYGKGKLVGLLPCRAVAILIHTVRCGHVKSSAGALGHLPAGVGHIAHLGEALSFLTIQALEGSHHDGGS